jgi:amino acid transporter
MAVVSFIWFILPILIIVGVFVYIFRQAKAHPETRPEKLTNTNWLNVAVGIFLILVGWSIVAKTPRSPDIDLGVYFLALGGFFAGTGRPAFGKPKQVNPPQATSRKSKAKS